MKYNRIEAERAGTEVVGLLWRYVCAVVVALLVSAIITLLGVTAMGKGMVEFLSGAYNHPVYPTASYCVGYTAAFAAVLLGSLCLPASSRSLAGAALVILGLAYYMTFWYVYWRHQMPSKHGNDPRVLPLVVGGLCAIWATVSSVRRAKAVTDRADAARTPDRLLACFWWRHFLFGMAGGIALLWAAFYVLAI